MVTSMSSYYGCYCDLLLTYLKSNRLDEVTRKDRIGTKAKAGILNTHFITTFFL